MQMDDILDTKLRRLRKIADELLTILPTPLGERSQVPESGGVYVFYQRRSDPWQRMKPIYVGKAGNLRTRLHTDHLSAEKKDSMSGLRGSVQQRYGVQFGEEMKNWIAENCKLALIQIDNADDRGMVEAYLIACLRSSYLLNKS